MLLRLKLYYIDVSDEFYIHFVFGYACVCIVKCTCVEVK